MKYKGAMIEYVGSGLSVTVDLPSCNKRFSRSTAAAGKRMVNNYLDAVAKINTPKDVPVRYLKEDNKSYELRCNRATEMTIGEHLLYNLCITRKHINV